MSENSTEMSEGTKAASGEAGATGTSGPAEPAGRRVLILTAAFGAGHVKAAEALKVALRELSPATEVVVVDFLRYFNRYVARIAEEAYVTAARRVPKAYEFLYEYEEQRPFTRLKRLQSSMGVVKLARLVDQVRPEVIVSTHFFPAGAVWRLQVRLAKQGRHLPNAVVMTDYVPHPIWVFPAVDAFFVAHDAMRDYLLEMGISPEKIQVTGIPIKGEFGLPHSRADLMKKHGLDPSLPMVLVLSGGRGVGPFPRIMEAMERVEAPVQLAVIAGRNASLETRLKKMAQQMQMPVTVLGYVENVHEWMAMADLLISKAGGLTVSEAMAAGLPMLIVKPIPGQEVGNMEFLVERGVGRYIKEIDELTGMVESLLRAPETLKRMRAAAREIARPDAARQAAQVILRLGNR
ncbi:MAG: MGDG synthase family glycosyltransferase [Syntrophothermus sp.]